MASLGAVVPTAVVLLAAFVRRDQAAGLLREIESTAHLIYLTFMSAVLTRDQGGRAGKAGLPPGVVLRKAGAPSVELDNARALLLDLARNMNE